MSEEYDEIIALMRSLEATGDVGRRDALEKRIFAYIFRDSVRSRFSRALWKELTERERYDLIRRPEAIHALSEQPWADAPHPLTLLPQLHHAIDAHDDACPACGEVWDDDDYGNMLASGHTLSVTNVELRIDRTTPEHGDEFIVSAYAPHHGFTEVFGAFWVHCDSCDAPLLMRRYTPASRPVRWDEEEE